MVIQHKISLQTHKNKACYIQIKGSFAIPPSEKAEMVENDVYVSKIYLKLKLEKTFPIQQDWHTVCFPQAST